MTTTRSPRRAGVFVALVFVACSSALRAQPPAIRMDARADRDTITLAQPVRVALTIEGPAPLRVELPKELLTADANTVWRIRPDPAAGRAEVTPAGAGRERWRQVYRLDPYPPAGALVVRFNPVTVNGQPVTWDPVPITVTKTIDDPATTPPRPPTDVEDPPPPPKTIDRAFPVWPVVMVGLACVAVGVVFVLRKRKVAPVPPGAWALARLAKLEGTSGAKTVERVAAILRGFVERRFAIPATKLTTSELAAAAREQGWPVERAEPIGAILDACDRAKFAGDVPDGDGCRRLVRLAVDWVNDVCRPAGPG